MRWLLAPLLLTTLVAEVPQNADIVGAKDWAATTERQVQAERDPRFIFATIFSNVDQVKAFVKNVNKPDPPLAESLNRSKILSRIVVTMALGGLKYTQTDKANLKDWEWPLATAISHGQRVIFEFDDLDNAARVYTLWVNGKPLEDFKNFEDPYKRGYGTHGFSFGSDGKTLKEEKIKIDPVAHVVNWLKGNHHGIDLPFGGLGAVRLDNAYVGTAGFALENKDFALRPKSQHGHLYIFTDQSNKNVSGLLVGIEPSAPGSKSMFGTEHDALSGLADSTEAVGVNGGQKMQKLLGAQGPAQYGGMWVIFKTANDFKHLGEALQFVDNLEPRAKRELFWEMLRQPAPLAREALKKCLLAKIDSISPAFQQALSQK